MHSTSCMTVGPSHQNALRWQRRQVWWQNAGMYVSPVRDTPDREETDVSPKVDIDV
jgi:hypothetical protein